MVTAWLWVGPFIVAGMGARVCLCFRIKERASLKAEPGAAALARTISRAKRCVICPAGTLSRAWEQARIYVALKMSAAGISASIPVTACRGGAHIVGPRNPIIVFGYEESGFRAGGRGRFFGMGFTHIEFQFVPFDGPHGSDLPLHGGFVA